jgi:hypothetical protein
LLDKALLLFGAFDFLLLELLDDAEGSSDGAVAGEGAVVWGADVTVGRIEGAGEPGKLLDLELDEPDLLDVIL